MRDAAKKAGFNQSAFTRWKGGAKADPEFVVKFARAFNLNVLEALVEAEFITEEEASLGSNKGERLHATIHAFEAEALALNAASEIAEHAAASIKAAYVKDVLGETIQASGFSNWEEIDKKFNEACAASSTPHLTPVSEVDDSMPLSAVAYSGPDEDAERNDAYDD
ncbi:hypothetical protein HMPREF3147_00865 [Corynebacterium sp. HMSC05D03]|nr:hypothetical protein HMPREF3147_00865 [Corynebacterium sp. HMSC05D03]